MLRKMSVNLTAVTMTILRFLAEDPDNSFHGREIAERAGVSSGAASITLRVLEGSGLLEMEEKGRMKFYRLNLSNPVSREFKVLFNIMDLRKLVEDLKADAERMILFGSGAEGKDAKDSDLDLYILTRDPSKAKDAVRRAEKKLVRHLSTIIVDAQGEIRLRRDERPLYDNISRGRVLWEKE
jgi:DNA-binding transcriptional ArsR family regulator